MWERNAQTPDTERRAELLIDVQRMSKIYNEGRENEVRALDDISLQVSWGEFLCILGQSGSGKSTLMNILRRLAQEALVSVGLEKRMDHRPGEMSGGQQQRVAIARAVAAKPPIIMADEPTGNLDSASGLDIMRKLTALNEQGTSIILITHDNHLAQMAKRIVTIQDGRIISDTKGGAV